MSTDDRIGKYVEAATAGLKPDRELRLDVQAELRSHLEERLREEAASAEPAPGDGDAVDRALAALGPVTDVAGDLAAANQQRMKFRARFRLLLRWLLLPLTVIAALYAIDLGPLLMMKQMFANRDGDFFNFNSALISWLPCNWFKPKFTPDQNLILHGDSSRPTPALQQRAIWEKHPESKVYYGNYITFAMGTVSKTNPEPEKLALLEKELEQGWKLEPDNARFDYILAGKLLYQAVKIDTPQTGKDKDGKSLYDLTWEIKDQAKLDRAMKLFQDGLAKPELRRYCREMLLERLKIMGPPDSMLSNIEQISTAAGVLLPDLSMYRQLARASVLYARQLIAEGRTAEAVPFLNAWQTLAVQINDGSFTLIDVLVEGAIIELGRKHIPDLWLKAGQPEQAEISRRNAEILGKPVRDWQEKRKNPERNQVRQDNEQMLKKSGSILAGLLLPALDEFPTEKDYEPGRLVEYVMVERVVLALLALLLMIGMLGCGLIYLRWRLMASGGASIPLLLLPDGRETLRILGFGIILPVLGYYLYSRWLPLSLRTYNLSIMWPQVLLEIALLLILILGLTSHLAVNAVRRRCRTLGVETPPESRIWRWFMRVTLVAVVVSLLWRQECVWNNGSGEGITLLLAIGLGSVVVGGLGGKAFYQLLEALFSNRKFGLFYGSAARTLIPFLALGVILLSFMGKPYLNVSERHLIQGDPLIRIDSTGGGFTNVESQLVKRMTTEIRQAAATLEKK